MASAGIMCPAHKPSPPRYHQRLVSMTVQSPQHGAIIVQACLAFEECLLCTFTKVCDKGLWLSRWRSWERAVRFVGVWGAFGVLTLFYLIPIIAIQGLINIDQLRKIHVIAVIIDLPVVRSIITAILPGTVLRPFWAIQIAVPAVQNLSCSMAASGLQNDSLLQHSLPCCSICQYA